MKTAILIICYKHKILANGECPLMLRVHKDGKRTMKSLGISVNPLLWDFKKEEPKTKCPNRDYINQIILKTRLEYERKLLQKQVNEDTFTAESFVKEETADKAIKAHTVDDFYKSVIFIFDLRATGNVGNSSMPT
jgi:NifB/MoaA-like Fe-S oxidoreductase